MVKEVLESMGHFKAWVPPDPTKPQEEEEDSDSSDEEMTDEERHAKWVRKLLSIVPKKTLDDFKKIDGESFVLRIVNSKSWKFVRY